MISQGILPNKIKKSMHGDEERKKSPSDIFSKKIADEALKNAKFGMEQVENLFELFFETK